MFIAAHVFIRVAGMRSFGTHSAFDIVLSITPGSVLSRCITGHYPFFPTLGTALVMALLHRVIAFLSYRSKTIHRLVAGSADKIYENGQLVKHNLARHCIADEELMKELRGQSLEDFSKVKTMYVEHDEKISIIRNEE